MIKAREVTYFTHTVNPLKHTFVLLQRGYCNELCVSMVLSEYGFHLLDRVWCGEYKYLSRLDCTEDDVCGISNDNFLRPLFIRRKRR
jgi:hypothetical protein